MGLVITMKPGQRVRIGQEAWVVYLGPAPGKDAISVGFDAPREVIISREELLPLSERFYVNDSPL